MIVLLLLLFMVVLVGLIGLIEAAAFVVHLFGMGLDTKVVIPVEGQSGEENMVLERGYISSLLLCGPGFIILCWYIGRNLLQGAPRIRIITITFAVIFFSYKILMVYMLNKAPSLPRWLDIWAILEIVEVLLLIPLLIIACMPQLICGSKAENPEQV